MMKLSLYIWISWLLCAGTLSDQEIKGCEQQPCQNGGICESQNGGFRCLCSERSQDGRLYGGQTCTVVLTGCDGDSCENGGMCSPLLTDGQHTHTCVCLAGFTGPKCQTPTAFSFETRGFVHVETPLADPRAPLNVTFSFRTGRPVGTLLQRRAGADDPHLLAVELKDGRLRLTSLTGQGSSRALVQELPGDVSDNKWHAVEALLGGAVSRIRLLCTDGGCDRHAITETRQLPPGPGPAAAPGSPASQSLLIGAASLAQGSGTAVDGQGAFLGCLRDVLVDSRLVVVLPGSEESRARANVTVGCSDKDKCDDSPCQNRGRCVSQGWRSYACECQRPYEGPNCTEEYITARFGNENMESYGVFSLDDHPGSAVTVSMFIRTRQSSGVLLVLANSTSQYLRLWLEQGRVKIQVNTFESLRGQSVISNGHFHLLTVKLQGDAASLFQSAQSQGSFPVRHVQAHPGDLVYVGGLPDPRASAAFGGYFKGCVQDLRINSKRLQFYPIATSVANYRLEQRVNVAQGCSSDNACTINPCLNGGVCYSMWDDFSCSCPPNTAGRRCEEVKWCELSPCPSSAICQLLSQGFECLSNVTLRGDRGIFSYQGNGKITRSLSSVFLSLRTRQPDATLLRAETGSSHVTVSIQDSRLLMELQAGDVGEGSPKLTVQSQGPVSDGEWHTVELSMENETLRSSRWILVVDGDGGKGETRVSDTRAGNLDFLREGADIHVGGPGPDPRGGSGAASLAGCLGPVEIGGLHLPFYGDTELNLPRPQEEQFVRTTTTTTSAAADPQHGCYGGRVCEPNPCQNRGVCEELFDLSRCACPSGWAGPLCQDPADTCATGPCIHGTCADRLLPSGGGYECTCEAGYGGARCEVEVNTCEENNCSLGATCLRGLRDYSCLCPHNTTGIYCDEKILEIPWYIESIPFPTLPVSVCQGKRWNYNCFNGGNCSNVEDMCDCLPGFIGQWCERYVDRCASGPCQHGGYCFNQVNSFKCVCDVNHSGQQCQIDLSDFYLYLFLAVWQNVFQLISYLLLRFDDGPEVDWDWGDYADDGAAVAQEVEQDEVEQDEVEQDVQ